MSQPPGYAVWVRDDAACSEALRSGAPVEVALSSFGDNDGVLDFLVTSGLWSVLTSMEPDGLRKENGKPWRALNGVEVLRELARVDRIAHCGKIVRDVRLMMIAGFNAEAVARARARDRPVVDPETLANHLARISPRSAARTFAEHVDLLRRKRWIRGRTYVADAHELIVPYGRHSERLGRIGEKYGYKLVILLNATPSASVSSASPSAPSSTASGASCGSSCATSSGDSAPSATGCTRCCSTAATGAPSSSSASTAATASTW